VIYSSERKAFYEKLNKAKPEKSGDAKLQGLLQWNVSQLPQRERIALRLFLYF